MRILYLLKQINGIYSEDADRCHAPLFSHTGCNVAMDQALTLRHPDTLEGTPRQKIDFRRDEVHCPAPLFSHTGRSDAMDQIRILPRRDTFQDTPTQKTDFLLDAAHYPGTHGHPFRHNDAMAPSLNPSHQGTQTHTPLGKIRSHGGGSHRQSLCVFRQLHNAAMESCHVCCIQARAVYNPL